MNKKKLAAVLTATSLAVVGIAGLTATAAMADPTPPQFYLLDGGDGAIIPDDTVLAWNHQVLASPGPDVVDLDTAFIGGGDATGVINFIAPVGQENTIGAWMATGPNAFAPSTQNVLSPNLTLSGFTAGQWATVKAGGSYSLGFAFTKNNGLAIAAAGVKFVHITVAPGGAGNWTFDDQAVPAEDPCVVDPDSCQSADIELSAETLAAQDAGLTLTVDATTATIGNPVLVNGISTSTGVLPAIRIHDARVVNHPGWELTTSLEDFTGPGGTIGKEWLGLAPTKTSGPASVSVGAAQVAGTGVYPSVFASAGNSAVVGDTVLGGNLTFVAPVGKAAGTYTSTLTLTLTSN